MLYFGPYRNPNWITPGFAILFFLFGIAATGTGEFIRESTRKPYIIYNYVVGNNVLVSEIPKLQKDGYLNGGVWTKEFMKEHYPEVFNKDGNIDNQRLLRLPEKDQLASRRSYISISLQRLPFAKRFLGGFRIDRGLDTRT